MDPYTTEKLAKIQTIHQFITAGFARLNYSVVSSPIADNSNGEYKFQIFDNANGYEIGNVSIVTLTSDIVQTRGARMTRHSLLNPVETDVINITGLGIKGDNKGKGLGTILLIYGLTYVMAIRPDIQYAILDDDTDRSNRTRNIYSGLLFAHNEHVEMYGPRNTILMAPKRKSHDGHLDHDKTAYIGDISYLDLLLSKVQQTMSGGYKSRRVRKKKLLKTTTKKIAHIQKTKNIIYILK